MSDEQPNTKVQFGCWEEDGVIKCAIRFPTLYGGRMTIESSMPAKRIGGTEEGPPPEQIQRMLLGIPLGALAIQEMVEGDAVKSANDVNAVLEALSKSKEQPELLETLKNSNDEGIKKALRFLAL